MLHELLLALSGDTGGIFVQKHKEGLKVAADIPFIHDCEVTLLNRICRLGTYYCCFQEFIKKHSGLVVKSGDSYNSYGLYIQAFCTGLEQVLHDYREILVELESQVLKDPCLPLSHVEHHLEKYQVLFPALDNLINQIQTQKAGGCKLLDILYQNSICGIPSVKECMERILYVCHGVLYQQLSAWLLHGLLTDSHNEFLITRVTSQNLDPSESVTEGVPDLGIPGVTGRQLAEIMDGEDKQSIPVLWKFKINADMLPSYIPTRVAEKILFVGDSVKMFEEAKQGNHGSTPTNSIVHEKEEEFLRSLYSLQQRPKFSLTAFESEIDKIRTYVAEHLWKLVIEDAQLLRHLQILKDFFLLGRGELFSALIEKAQQLLKVPPSGNTSHDANAFFQQVLHKFLSDEEDSTALFTLSVDLDMYQSKQKSVPDQVVVSGWDCLKLEYNVKWPLHILFQEPILDKYNMMFRHLLNVKRTQQDLQRVWAKHMGTKNQTNCISHLTRVWLLRMHMAFLVDNLQYYLQVDVLEAQYTQLIDKINNTRDFESIRLAHDHFITTLMAQSFLLMKPVAHCLEEILSLCQAYCTLLLQITNVISERTEGQLESISKNYERQSNLLFKILSSVRSHQASPHLAQLLLRIDFNKQFSAGSSPSSLKAQEPS